MLNLSPEHSAFAPVSLQPLGNLVQLKSVGTENRRSVESVLRSDPAPLISAEELRQEGYFQRYSPSELREGDLMQEEMRVAMWGNRAVGAYAISGIFHLEQASFIEVPATLRFLAVDPEFFSLHLMALILRDAVGVARHWNHDHIAADLAHSCAQKLEALRALGFFPAVVPLESSYFEQNWYLLDLLAVGDEGGELFAETARSSCTR